MVNEPKIELKIELNADIKNGKFIIKERVLTTEVKVYVCHEHVSCYVGTVSNMLDLFLLIGPESLMETLWDSASEYEYDALTTALESSNMKYWIGEHLFTANQMLND